MDELDDDLLRAMLREDVPFGDLTTSALGIADAPGRLTFAARRPMRVAGIEAAQRLFELSGARASVQVASGRDATAGEVLLRAEGTAGALLQGWKVAQTLVEALGGIATATAEILAALRSQGFDVPVACTRKNLPGSRRLTAHAVKAGGGVMHRLGLSESLLVFPEHRLFIAPDRLAETLRQVRRAQPEKRLVVEVGDAAEAMALTQAGADVLQLERFSPEALAALKAALAASGLSPLLAPAGGVTVHNALDYARAGADFLVTSAPYHAPPTDVKVTFEPASERAAWC